MLKDELNTLQIQQLMLNASTQGLMTRNRAFYTSWYRTQSICSNSSIKMQTTIESMKTISYSLIVHTNDSTTTFKFIEEWNSRLVIYFTL